MNHVWTIARRELRAYFATPVAYVFIVIFVALSGVFTFYLGNFFEREQADLTPFFGFHPWLHLVLAPAVSMRPVGRGAPVRQRGTPDDAADRALAGGAGQVPGGLVLHRGGAGADLPHLDHGQLPRRSGQRRDPRRLLRQRPDGGRLPGDRLLHFRRLPAARSWRSSRRWSCASGSCWPASRWSWTRSPAGPPTCWWDTIASLGFLTHFNAISKGVLDARDILYFLLVITAFLYANAIVLDLGRGN